MSGTLHVDSLPSEHGDHGGGDSQSIAGTPGTSGVSQSDEAPDHVLALGTLPEEGRVGAQSHHGPIYSDAKTTQALEHSAID